MDIYFDNAATTKMSDEVIDEIVNLEKTCYGNSESLHKFGYLAEKKIEEAIDVIKKFINCDENEIIWTSGGTESNNLAILGFLRTTKKKHIITSKIEHPSVYNIFSYLQKEGYRVTYLGNDNLGQIDYNELEKSIEEDTALVSIMHVNNEIGSLEDVKKISNIIKEKNKNIVFHTDAVQSFGKIKIDVKDMNIDMLSVSGHKIHGPKGIGLLYKNKNVRIDNIIYGGGQQNNIRSGTMNTSGIIGLKKAVEILKDSFYDINNYLLDIRNYTIEKLTKLNDEIGGIYINTKNSLNFSPHIVSVSIKDVRAEVLLHTLEEYNMYVSSGSACSSKNKNDNRVLKAIKIDENLVDKTIRLSFSKYNKREEVDIFIDTLKQEIPKLRKFVRR